MYFRVYLLRRNGLRLPWKDALNGPYYQGDVCSSYIASKREGRIDVLSFMKCRPSVKTLPPPVLYEPTLAGFATLAVTIRGIERIERAEGVYGVIQEWYCMAIPDL